jgi:ethanolamine transporter EutH
MHKHFILGDNLEQNKTMNYLIYISFTSCQQKTFQLLNSNNLLIKTTIPYFLAAFLLNSNLQLTYRKHRMMPIILLFDKMVKLVAFVGLLEIQIMQCTVKQEMNFAW